MRYVEWLPSTSHLGIIKPGDSVAAVENIERLSDSDLAALKLTADELGIPVDSLAAVMSMEGGFNPQAYNKSSGATGILQFLPSTARMLGTTVEELREMTFQQQLPYVVKFFEGNRCTGVEDPGEVYICVFCPALKDKPEDFIVAQTGVQEGSFCAPSVPQDRVYTQNRGLDINQDGIISAGEIRNKARNRLAAATERIPILDVPPEGAPSKKKRKESPLPVILGGAALVALGIWTGVIPV